MAVIYVLKKLQNPNHPSTSSCYQPTFTKFDAISRTRHSQSMWTNTITWNRILLSVV